MASSKAPLITLHLTCRGGQVIKVVRRQLVVEMVSEIPTRIVPWGLLRFRHSPTRCHNPNPSLYLLHPLARRLRQIFQRRQSPQHILNLARNTGMRHSKIRTGYFRRTRVLHLAALLKHQKDQRLLLEKLPYPRMRARSHRNISITCDQSIKPLQKNIRVVMVTPWTLIPVRRRYQALPRKDHERHLHRPS